MTKPIRLPVLSKEDIQSLHAWTDSLYVNKTKRSVIRDFADGSKVAEMVHSYFPRIADVHNYPQAHSFSQKLVNWQTLNVKVFQKLGFQLSNEDILAVVHFQSGVIEQVLAVVRYHIENLLFARHDPLPPVQAHFNAKARSSPRSNSPGHISLTLKNKDHAVNQAKVVIKGLQEQIDTLEQRINQQKAHIKLLNNKLAAAGLSIN